MRSIAVRYLVACTPEGVRGAHYWLTARMCRLLAAATILTVLTVGVAGRGILQNSGNVNPTSFAAKRNTNSQGTVSSDAAVQQGLQNQKTTQLQAHQITPKGTSKKTLQQVRRLAARTGILIRGSLHPTAQISTTTEAATLSCWRMDCARAEDRVLEERDSFAVAC